MAVDWKHRRYFPALLISMSFRGHCLMWFQPILDDRSISLLPWATARDGSWVWLAWHYLKMIKGNHIRSRKGYRTYGDINLVEVMFCYLLVGWRHQIINWTDVGLSSMGLFDTHQRSISRLVQRIWIRETSSKAICEIITTSLRGQRINWCDILFYEIIVMQCHLGLFRFRTHTLLTNTNTILIPKFEKKINLWGFWTKKTTLFNQNWWFLGQIKHPPFKANRVFVVI